MILCVLCEKKQERKYFYESYLRKNHNLCKKCVRKGEKERYRRNIEASRKRSREGLRKWRKENPKRSKLIDRKYVEKKRLKKKCIDCGKNAPMFHNSRCESCREIYREKRRKEYVIYAREYQREKAKTWTEEDKKKEAKRKHEWYVRNKDRILAKCKKYRTKNADKVSKKSKEYYYRKKKER